MDEPINRGHRHNAVREDLIPFAERLIGCDDETPAFVAVGDELEQDVSLRIRFLHITNIVNDEYPVFVQPGHCGHQIQVTFGLLQ